MIGRYSIISKEFNGSEGKSLLLIFIAGM